MACPLKRTLGMFMLPLQWREAAKDLAKTNPRPIPTAAEAGE